MEAIKNLLQRQVSGIQEVLPCTGGDISKAYQVLLTSGKKYFLKLNKPEMSDMFIAEKVGLRFLSENSSFRTPKVLDILQVGDSAGILMEWIEVSVPDALSWQKFGRSLGELHSVSSEKFGFEMENYIGSIRQRNQWDENWVEFWIERRIAPLVTKALDQGALRAQEAMPFIALFEQMRTHFGKHPFSPRLIHGDLWSGNLLFDENGDPTLIDPAVYFGWPEMELAFMELFGGFSKDWVSHYKPQGQEHYLGDNYYHIWQVYPLLIHTLLFGGMYQRRLLTCVHHALEVF